MSYEVTDFQTQVLERSKSLPVLVDFWAPWCGPCRTLGPILESMASRANGRWELAKINTEERQDLAAEFNIASIPAVKLFIDGKVADEFVGALPERDIQRFLDQSIPSPGAQQVAQALQLLDQGSTAQAAVLLEAIIRDEPGNLEARVALAQALLSSDPDRAAALLQAVPLDSELSEKANALRTLAHLVKVSSNPAALPEAKVREKYLLGAVAVRSADYEAALDAFIEVLDQNKQYADGGAKEACKAIFQFLGLRHPVVERNFRRFSSALHS